MRGTSALRSYRGVATPSASMASRFAELSGIGASMVKRLRSQRDRRAPHPRRVEQVHRPTQSQTHVFVRLARKRWIDLGDDAPLVAVVVDDEVDEHFGAEILDQ